jgi:HEAT repeat protein
MAGPDRRPLRYILVCIASLSTVGLSRAGTRAIPPDATAVVKCNEILQEGLTDSNPDTRKQAIVALSLLGAREAFLSNLEAALADSDVEVRLAAVASLAELKSQRATTALHVALGDSVPEVRFAAAKMLQARHDPAGEQALMEILEGQSKPASNALSKQKRDAMRVVHTPRALLMLALRYGVGFVPVPGLGQGIASMEALLTDPGVSGRAAAAIMLAGTNTTASADALKNALSDKDWRVRAAAVHALTLRNDPALASNVVTLLDDDSRAVRLRAAAACLRLSSSRSRSAKSVQSSR